MIAEYFKSQLALYCNYNDCMQKKNYAPYEYLKRLLNIKKKTRLDVDKQNVEIFKYNFENNLSDMSNGINSISNVKLLYLPKNVCGFPTQIIRNDEHGSRFGNYHYIIKEKTYKSNITIDYILLLAFFNYILGKIQHYTPKEFYIVDGEQPINAAYNRKPVETPYQYEKYTKLLHDTISQTRQIMSMNHSQSIHDSYSSWGNYYNRMARETDDLLLLHGVGLNTKFNLFNVGIKNLNDIITMSVYDLCEIDGIGKKTATNYISNANAIKNGKHIKKKKTVIPQNDVDIFIDLKKLEYPLNPVDLDYIPFIQTTTNHYLIGLTINNIYKPFMINNKNGEKTLHAFIDYIKVLKNYKLYHCVYLKTQLKNIFNRYNIYEEDQKLILDNLVDLHTIAIQSFAFPIPYSSEMIAIYMGFSWKYDGVNKLNLNESYKKYVDRGNINNLQPIHDYSRDYCNATKVIKEWLLVN